MIFLLRSSKVSFSVSYLVLSDSQPFPCIAWEIKLAIGREQFFAQQDEIAKEKRHNPLQKSDYVDRFYECAISVKWPSSLLTLVTTSVMFTACLMLILMESWRAETKSGETPVQ
jgi:hypothetical protein